MTAKTVYPKSEPNDLVRFLEGKWDHVGFVISNGNPIKKEKYCETMIIKDVNTLAITAHGFKEGTDLTKDMYLEISGNAIRMKQGDFEATGTCEDAVYSMKGISDDTEYRFRLYALGDKYVFHRETWKGNKIQQIDMSYLVRNSDADV